LAIRCARRRRCPDFTEVGQPSSVPQEIAMIAPAVWNPALLVARMQSRDDRFDSAVAGMTDIIDDFFQESARCWASRRADMLTPIDNAARAVRAGWVGWGGAGLASDAAVTTLLNACTTWIAAHQFRGIQFTHWRASHIKKLYWQTAWCYAADHYVQQAMATVAANNALGNATLTTDPVPMVAAVGNPYQFAPLSGYAHRPTGARTLRGDTRGPDAIAIAGFQARHLANRWQYKPFFARDAVATPSTTTDEALATEAPAAAHALGSPWGAAPNWLLPTLGALGVNVGPARGFVYELNVANLTSTLLVGRPVGLEHVFLGIPVPLITNWWVVTGNRRTVGPFPFPPVAPVGLAPGAPMAPLPNVSAVHALA
jgi:hypothetical protein